MTFPIDVYIGAGSNIEPEKNLRLACTQLRNTYGTVELSPLYETAAVGFDGDDFLNMVLRVATVQSLSDVIGELERIHDFCGRVRAQKKYGPRVLDLDVLLYGELCKSKPPVRLPRGDITRYAFVLAPLADLAPELIHPVEKRTMRELWADFADSTQVIHRRSEAL